MLGFVNTHITYKSKLIDFFAFINSNNHEIYNFFFYLFLTSFIFAQESCLGGVLLDGEFDNEPLAFATVTIQGMGLTVNTDLKGEYHLEIEPGIYTLVFDFVGYESKKIENVVIEKNSIRLNDEVMYARKVAMRIASID